MQTQWKRNCPKCDGEKVYKSKHGFECAELNNSYCNSCCQLKCDIKYDIKLDHKLCPSCNKKQFYHNKNSLISAINKNTKCKSCSNKIGRNWSKGKKFTKKHKLNLSKSHQGKKFTEEHKENLRLSLLGNEPWNKGRVGIYDETTLQKLREARIEQLKNSYSHANYNELACKYFDWLNMYMSWDGQHAKYKGEKSVIGYSLDYYEPELNLVIEWDEEYHFKNDKLREKDIIRQSKIIDELNCDFYRIRQKDMNLYKI